MEAGLFRKDDVWEIVFETGALMQGLIMLYLGGRVAHVAGGVPRLLSSVLWEIFNGIRAKYPAC